MKDFSSQRQQLLYVLQQSGIRDTHVLDTIARVPRELFVTERLFSLSYDNQALPLACGQTISQPLMVAVMTQALQLHGKERVLEIGTGSGYQTAILASLASQVYTIERYAQLSSQARSSLAQLKLHNISFLVGDGSLGWPEFSPYDRILVTAASPILPPSLWQQLAPSGLLVMPIGSTHHQDLQQITRLPSGGRQVKSLGGCIFVPLIGKEGWQTE